jgi:hypothetical protein
MPWESFATRIGPDKSPFSKALGGDARQFLHGIDAQNSCTFADPNYKEAICRLRRFREQSEPAPKVNNGKDGASNVDDSFDAIRLPGHGRD